MERIIEPITFDISRKAPDIAFDLGVSVTGGGTTEGAVRYDVAQELTEDQQAQARENITAVFDDGTDLFASFYNAGLVDALQEPNGAFLTSGNAVLTY